MTNPEAREHRRARARVRVEYHFGSTTATGHCSDISEGGMFLECTKIAPHGTRVYLRVHLPGTRAGDPLKIIGTVTRAVEGGPTVTTQPEATTGDASDGTPGMALHFEVAYARTREQLSEFMQNLLHDSSERSRTVEPNDIRLVAGSTPNNPTYKARFPPTSDGANDRPETMRPPEVERAFAFDVDEAADDDSRADLDVVAPAGTPPSRARRSDTPSSRSLAQGPAPAPERHHRGEAALKWLLLAGVLAAIGYALAIYTGVLSNVR